MKRIAVVLICMASALLYAQTPDPGIGGPFAVASMSYDFGPEAFDPPSFPDAVEVTGNVHYPADLAGGPYSVLLFLHGRHSSCYNPATSTTNISWPCTGSFEPIPSYEGYDYLAEHFAGLGYIVISVSANSISSTDNFVADYGMQARGELLQHHLDLWSEWNTVGGDPFGDTFVGKLDLSNIGTMGHSRGGEGVIFHALYNRSLGSPYGINAVITLAPVDFNRQILTGTPILNIAPYCDGDVSDLQGVHFYDDVRYAEADDEAPKHGLLLLGGNHNFFNTVWTPGLFPAGTADDWGFVDWTQNDDHCGTSSPGNGRMNPTTQRNALLAYSSAFFRFYIGNETDYAPILETEDILPPVSSTLDADEVFVSFHPSNRKKINLNSLTSEASETVNDLGGAAGASGLVTFDICGDDLGEQFCLDVGSSQEPHCKSGGITMPGLSQLRIEWNSAGDYFQNLLPEGFNDLSPFDAIQFRAANDFTTTTTTTDFLVQLEDADGNLSAVAVSDYSNVLFYPPGDIGTTLPRIMHNTVKIPLAAFTGVDMTSIVAVRLVYDAGSSDGILLSDILLSSNEILYFPPAAAFTSNTTSTCDGVVQFTDLSGFFPESWLWDFGDGSTSTEENPVYTYSENGFYTVTLTVENPAGMDVIAIPAYIEVNRPESPLTTPSFICEGDTAFITATPLSGGTILWTNEDGAEVGEGETIVYSAATDTTFFAQEIVESPLLSLGPEDNTFGGGGYFDGNDLRGIFFDVFSPFTLETVKVYADSPGERTIQVLNGEGGSVVHTATVFLTAGEQVVDLNFFMEPGLQYYIKVTGDLVDLFRINDGSPDYPYTVPGIAALTGSNVSGAEEDYYYFFFDWKIREQACQSLPATVPVVVNPLPVVAVSNDTTILEGSTVILEASGGGTYSWEPVLGLSNPFAASTEATPLITTTYVVTVTDVNGCSSVDSVTVTVSPQTGLDTTGFGRIQLYPNPANEWLIVKGLPDTPVIIHVYNILGLQVGTFSSNGNTATLPVQDLPAGSYVLRMIIGQAGYANAFVIQH